MTTNPVSAYTLQDATTEKLPNVAVDELDIVRSLLAVWRSKLRKNIERSFYYDGEQAFKDLGIALPPQLRNAKAVLGWPALAVRKLAQRSQFEGLRLPGSSDPFELSETFERNWFDLEFGQAVTSGYKHGCAFASVAKGLFGEPDVQIQFHAADSSAAIWDKRKRQVKYGLSIGSFDGDKPMEMVAWLPDVILVCTRPKGGKWKVDRISNSIGHALFVPITYDPQLGQPFGRSRISNPSMALTDMGVRGYVRMEGNAEFYSAPNIALGGVDADAFENMSDDRRMQIAMNRLLAISKDEDGDTPTIQQLRQASMEPHVAMIRTIAAAFAGETGIPLSSLGIVQDNPSSAEAIRANEHDLLLEATFQNKYVLSAAIKQISQLTLMVRDGLAEPPRESWGLQSRFADPEFQSLNAKADGVVKLVQADPELSGSEVLYEQIFDEDQLLRLRDERSRSQSRNLVSQLASLSVQAPTAQLR